MKRARPVAWWGAVGLAAVGLVVLPRYLQTYMGTAAFALAYDAVVGMVALWALLWVGRGWIRHPRFALAGWRSVLLAVPWAVLASFEIARVGARKATNEELPMYDAALLSRYLYILGRDLYGAWAHVGLTAALLTPLLLVAVGALLYGRIEAGFRALGPRRSAFALVAAAALVSIGELSPESRFSAPVFTENMQRSYVLYRSTLDELANAHHEFDDVALAVKPNVVFYVVESYGAVTLTDPRFATAWSTELDEMDARMRAAGWFTAGGTCAAPVHGGRSWMADSSLFLGMKISHQSSYEHVMTQVDALPHLPDFFARQGYTTVLVHPKDRARAGVQLENDFRFHRPVFAVELDYSGKPFGWGEIPDQFTIDRVQDEILDPIQGPWFAFFHLVSSHLPWNEVPPLVSHWSDWQQGIEKVHVDRSVDSERRMRISRFKRTLREDAEKKKVEDEDAQRYMQNVHYDFMAIGRRLDSGPQRPTLVVIMGDHQPPIVAEGTGPEVPIHLIASDPALLREFQAAGFEPHLRPREIPAKIGHQDLFPLMVRTLVGLE